MESKFNIGDRVYHHPEGTGTVTGYQDGRVIVDPDDEFYTQKWLCEEEDLERAATGAKSCHYYEEVTRNGQQWFRITPKGEWMPKRDTDDSVRTGDGTTILPTVEQKYDRAGMATVAMKEILSWDGMTDPVVVAKQAVRFTDALIAELQRTEK